MAENELGRAEEVAGRRSQSNWMLAFGAVLFALAGYGASQSPDGVPMGIFLFALLAVGLIVGGLVIRR